MQPTEKTTTIQPKKKRRKKAPQFSRKRKKTSTQNKNSQLTNDDDEVTQYVAPQSESILKRMPPPVNKTEKRMMCDYPKYQPQHMATAHNCKQSPLRVYDFHDDVSFDNVVAKPRMQSNIYNIDRAAAFNDVCQPDHMKR